MDESVCKYNLADTHCEKCVVKMFFSEKCVVKMFFNKNVLLKYASNICENVLQREVFVKMCFNEKRRLFQDAPLLA